MTGVAPGDSTASAAAHDGRTLQYANLSLSVFFPAYNDCLSLPALIDKTFGVLENHVADFEVIVVNDGSEDNTREVLKQLQSKHGSRLRIVDHGLNLGYGAALQSGFRAARKEWVFYTDGDGQYDVDELPLLLEQAKASTGFVNGFKTLRHDPWYRRILGSGYGKTVRFLFRLRIKDVDCDYRLIRRELLQNIDLTSTSGTICIELVHKLESQGAFAVEVPVHHYPRLHGKSQFFRVRPLFNTYCQLISLLLRLNLR